MRKYFDRQQTAHFKPQLCVEARVQSINKCTQPFIQPHGQLNDKSRPQPPATAGVKVENGLMAGKQWIHLKVYYLHSSHAWKSEYFAGIFNSNHIFWIKECKINHLKKQCNQKQQLDK